MILFELASYGYFSTKLKSLSAVYRNLEMNISGAQAEGEVSSK